MFSGIKDTLGGALSFAQFYFLTHDVNSSCRPFKRQKCYHLHDEGKIALLCVANWVQQQIDAGSNNK